jgi:hypothetical protein
MITNSLIQKLPAQDTYISVMFGKLLTGAKRKEKNETGYHTLINTLCLALPLTS